MGKGQGSDKYKARPVDLKMLELAMGLGRRQLTVLCNRYKIVLLLGFFLLVVWASTGKKEAEEEMESPPLPSKLQMPEKAARDGGREFLDFDYKYDRRKSEKGREDVRNVKEEVARVVAQARVEHNQIKENLILDGSSINREKPKQDLRSQGGGKMLATRRRSDTLNGVQLPAEPAGADQEWVVVGGRELFNDDDQHRAAVHDEFAIDLANIVPGLGEGGEPVVLSGHEATQAEAVIKKEAFNLVVSDKISYTREVPDTRDSRCKAVYYDKELPSTSVIIIFTNEAWSPLIRTIWSVLNRSPDHLIHEIILVDDFSDKPHLKGKLERYISTKLPSKVKLMRLRKREGLIRARLEGARAATGEVMLYLDSHCECNEGWLEPLLARIKENPKAFVVPIIDVIDDKTLEYYHGNGNYFQVGGFTWSGHFTWVDIPPSELARRGSPIAPTRSPTMAGGLFAVARDTFWALGSYDPEMDVWGGENLEMSFRIWQCGGVLETIPCSRVGHIFRSFHPYTFPGNKDTHGINTARTVEVWMDDYKRLFYMHRPDLLNSDIGSVTNRLKFKQDLQCKPFSWFLKNVYPEKFILDDPKHVFAYGRLKNPTSSTCLDNLQNDDKDSYELGQYACHNFMASAQFFSFSKKYELRREDNCAQVSAPFPQRHEKVEMATCHGQGGEQDWAHTKEGKIIHKETKKCLDAGRGQSMDLLYVAPCQNIPSQVWYFDHYLN